MASGTRSKLKAANVDPTSIREQWHQIDVACRKGEYKEPCYGHDHERPETLPPLPKGRFEEQYEFGRIYYPTLDEQWPSEIPKGLEPCNLEQFKPQLVYVGKRKKLRPGICDHNVLEELHKTQIRLAMYLWRNKVPNSELEKIPLDLRCRYIY